MQAIQTRQLTKYYGKNRGIEDVSLSVEEGEFCGFIGPNGAGKSTTMRILLGLITATSGMAELFGQDVRAHGTELLSRIGYLPSETVFYDGMRVREILRLSAGLRGRDCAREAGRLCERLELDPSKKVEELSLGNRKKVGIVCAMQHRPELYLMDEPTSGLDPLIQKEFFALLAERNREGATVFLSSHVLSEVQRYCTHAVVLRDGRLLVADRVDRIGHTDARRVTVKGVREAPGMERIRDVRHLEDGVSFLYDGRPEHLLRTLADLPLTDVTITEPDLEEVLWHYYEEGEHGHSET